VQLKKEKWLPIEKEKNTLDSYRPSHGRHLLQPTGIVREPPCRSSLRFIISHFK
jgi:hypothetical protein